MIDETLLADPGRCPACAAILRSPATECPACHLSLRGPTAGRLWDVSREVARLLGERTRLIAVLRAEATIPAYVATAPGPELPPPPRPAMAGRPVGHPAAGRVDPAAGPEPAARARRGPARRRRGHLRRRLVGPARRGRPGCGPDRGDCAVLRCRDRRAPARSDRDRGGPVPADRRPGAPGLRRRPRSQPLRPARRRRPRRRCRLRRPGGVAGRCRCGHPPHARAAALGRRAGPAPCPAARGAPGRHVTPPRGAAGSRDHRTGAPRPGRGRVVARPRRLPGRPRRGGRRRRRGRCGGDRAGARRGLRRRGFAGRRLDAAARPRRRCRSSRRGRRRPPGRRPCPHVPSRGGGRARRRLGLGVGRRRGGRQVAPARAGRDRRRAARRHRPGAARPSRRTGRRDPGGHDAAVGLVPRGPAARRCGSGAVADPGLVR